MSTDCESSKVVMMMSSQSQGRQIQDKKRDSTEDQHYVSEVEGRKGSRVVEKEICNFYLVLCTDLDFLQGMSCDLSSQWSLTELLLVDYFLGIPQEC